MRRSAAGLALGVGLLGAVLLAGCGGSSGSSSKVPEGDVAVVDGQNISVSDLQTTMNIARLTLRTSFPEPGTQDWVSLRSRALESLAHDAELRAWAHNLGVTVKPSAVDAAVKSTLLSAFPSQTKGSIDQAKVDAEFKSTGMTRALFRSRTETKLLAQAAADKVAVAPSVTDAQIQAQYDKDKASLYTQPERRKLRHILVKDKALADQLYSQLQSSDASFAELAKKYSTDSSKTAGGELGVVNRSRLVKPFADVAFKLPVGVVSTPTKTQFGWHLIEAEGPVLKPSVRPLDVTVKVQIRSQLAQQQRQKSIAQKFAAAELDLSRNIQFAPGYAPPVATSTQ
ncbi:MAG TPA: peptidylprolyl isomerase [Gaiellales bacterium]|jgi:parvulin-like peptidyl-prolyl isomerase|nr:peptidylprolyl isomerase [Gaiellales bacterium]